MQLLDSDASTFSDVILVSSNGARIPAHRCLLHCRCEFFAAMLGGGWIESETHEIQLKGVSHPIVDAMLRFMYRGIASLSDEVNLRDLLSAADMYGLEELKELTAFHLKRDWCHLFHKPMCAECLSLIPHCYAVSESYGLPDLSLSCLRWMSKNLDRFWVQKTFSALPTEMLEKCSKDVVESLNFKSVIEVLFQLDKLRLGLPQGQSSWAEPVKDITSKTRKQVLRFAANKFYVILGDGSTFEDKYLKGMGWKKDVMEPLFRTVVAALSLENADLNFQAVWRLYKRERTEKEKEQGKIPEEEWNQDAYVAVGGLYEKLYNYAVSNASYIIHTEGFKQLPDDLQKQIRKDAVYVDEGLSKTTKKPVLSSSQRPKSAQVRRTLSHPLRASSPASSTSSASSTGSAPSSSRSRGGGTRSTRGVVTGSSRGARNAPRESGGSVRGAGGPQRGTGHSARGNRVPPRGTGSRSSRVTGRAGGPARGNGTSGSRGGVVGVSGRGGAQQQSGPSDGGQPQGS
nr:BTB/POZ domain-containing protein 8-like [Lytechinus pictus]